MPFYVTVYDFSSDTNSCLYVTISFSGKEDIGNRPVHVLLGKEIIFVTDIQK